MGVNYKFAVALLFLAFPAGAQVQRALNSQQAPDFIPLNPTRSSSVSSLEQRVKQLKDQVKTLRFQLNGLKDIMKAMAGAVPGRQLRRAISATGPTAGRPDLHEVLGEEIDFLSHGCDDRYMSTLAKALIVAPMAMGQPPEAADAVFGQKLRLPPTVLRL
ncbi:MAG TPA: hypothetical protein VGS20_14775 [Candidatus Acidoferrales bacterium]|nr:hypothetical protein [Candidatus Acidoferrales bacterium]